jgi:hypothetical protein
MVPGHRYLFLIQAFGFLDHFKKAKSLDLFIDRCERGGAIAESECAARCVANHGLREGGNASFF